ncbi:13611_t:CDS:1, partial [Gigaspora margarita]
SAKSEQGIELPISQEESLTSKESNMIKNKEILQESGKSKIKTNCKQISILDKENLQRNEHKSIKYFTLWDLPNSISNRYIIAIVKNMDKVWEVQIRYGRNNKTRAELAIEMNRKKYEEVVKNMWSLPLINGSLARFTPGSSDNSILEKRRIYYARLKNVPKNAKEVLLLRQICHLGVKTVHIFNNKNGNRKEVAVVEFTNKQEKEKAASSKAFYFNTKLQ